MLRMIGIWGAVAAIFLSASPALAATWIVRAGPPTGPPGGVPRTAEQNRFFPSTLHIHRGDSVRFLSSRGLHTATFLGAHPRSHFPYFKRGSGAYGGTPFWFNGRTKWVYNTAVLQPSGSRTVADRNVHNSGALRGRGYTFRFTKVGRFNVVCLTHPGMSGTIVVHRAGEKIASAGAVRRTAAREIASGWRTAKALAQVDVGARTVFAGVGGKVTINSFFPRNLTVPLNAIVTFKNMSPSEFHNMAWPRRDDSIDNFHAQTDIFPLPNAARGNQVGPFFIYGSDRPAGGAYHHTSADDVLVTPLIDAVRGGRPNQSRVMFMAPGRHEYYCLYHGRSMSGTITVTGS